MKFASSPRYLSKFPTGRQQWQAEEMIKSSVYMGDTTISARFLWSAGCMGRAKREALALSLSGWQAAGLQRWRFGRSQRSLWLVRAWPGKGQAQIEFLSDLRAAITWPEQILHRNSDAQSRLINNLRHWK